MHVAGLKKQGVLLFMEEKLLGCLVASLLPEAWNGSAWSHRCSAGCRQGFTASAEKSQGKIFGQVRARWECHHLIPACCGAGGACSQSIQQLQPRAGRGRLGLN